MSSNVTSVLLIEDDPIDIAACRRFLTKASGRFAVEHVTCLAAAIDLLNDRQFDVILTDLSLPDAKGLKAVRELNQRWRDQAIVVLTGLEDKEIEVESLSYGAQDFLRKREVSSHTLERAIRHAQHRQQITAQNTKLVDELRGSRNQLAEQAELLARKNRRLKRLYKTAHRFVGNVSHEFRTPLTVINDYVSLIREGIAGEINDQQKQMLEVTMVRVGDLNNMVDDMLDVSKLQSGLLGAWRRNSRIDEIAEMVLPGLVQKAAVKDIEFRRKISADLPEVYCDAEKVGRVIINLVTNAMKFCGDPGEVTLWAEANQQARELVVGVTDNGNGIEPEQMKRIFERFHQAGSPRSAVKGFGLGLNIAKELVDLNLGKMSVRSEAEQGSTFSFTVPLADPYSVMQRYCARIIRRSKGLPQVSLIEATIDESLGSGAADDTDSFLNYILRRHDMLFRVGLYRWLIVLPAAATEIEQYLKRARLEFERANRNRPFGPLPEFAMHRRGTWQIRNNQEEMLREFSKLLEAEAYALPEFASC